MPNRIPEPVLRARGASGEGGVLWKTTRMASPMPRMIGRSSAGERQAPIGGGRVGARRRTAERTRRGRTGRYGSTVAPGYGERRLRIRQGIRGTLGDRTAGAVEGGLGASQHLRSGSGVRLRLRRPRRCRSTTAGRRRRAGRRTSLREGVRRGRTCGALLGRVCESIQPHRARASRPVGWAHVHRRAVAGPDRGSRGAGIIAASAARGRIRRDCWRGDRASAPREPEAAGTAFAFGPPPPRRRAPRHQPSSRRMSTRERAASVVMGHVPTTDAAALRSYMQDSGIGGFLLMALTSRDPRMSSAASRPRSRSILPSRPSWRSTRRAATSAACRGMTSPPLSS